jgi:hypothetical protein
MTVQDREPPDGVVKFAPKRGGGRDNSVTAGNNLPADDAGNGILALLHKAAESANEDCARAMDLARKLSVQLRDAEQRAHQLEAEANHFRERAATAENWLMRIHSEVEQTFFSEGRRERGHQGRE